MAVYSVTTKKTAFFTFFQSQRLLNDCHEGRPKRCFRGVLPQCVCMCDSLQL